LPSHGAENKGKPRLGEFRCSDTEPTPFQTPRQLNSAKVPETVPDSAKTPKNKRPFPAILAEHYSLPLFSEYDIMPVNEPFPLFLLLLERVGTFIAGKIIDAAR
jgi:hypothetical protein